MVAEQGDEVVERAGSLRQCSISRCTNSNSPSSGLASVSAIFPPAMISGGYGRRTAEITHAHRKDTEKRTVEQEKRAVQPDVGFFSLDREPVSKTCPRTNWGNRHGAAADLRILEVGSNQGTG